MKRLLTALDISDLSNSLIRFSFSFSIKHDIGHIDFIHVKEEEPEEMQEVPVKGYTGHFRSVTENRFYRNVSFMVEQNLEGRHDWITTYNILIAEGDPAEKVLERANEIDYEMILVGHHERKGLEKIFQGSVSAAISSSANAPVMVYIPRKAKWFI